jgi:signal transduction histidine kinase
VQSILFFLVLPISCLAVSANYGGYDKFSASLPIMDWKSNTYSTWMLISMFIYGLLPDCSSSFIQKCLIARDKNQLANALKTVGIIHIPIILSLCFIAYSVRAVYPAINPDQTIFYYINELAPMALRGIFSVCLIAIIMGMSDGILHATSTIVANDVVKVLFPDTTDEWLIKAARISIVVFSGIAMGFTFFSESILSMVYVMYSFWHPIIMVPLCAGFLGFKAKNKEFIASTIAAACAVSYGYYLELFPPVVLISGIIASFISFFAAHFMVKDGGSIDAFKEGLEKHFIMNMSSFKNWLKSHVIFPDEADMELGQRQIYQKFSVVMTAMLFIYMIVMKQGKAYEMMVGLVSLGYLMSTLLMIRDLLFRKQSDKWLKMLWYTSLAMIPIISSYAILINNGSNMILANAVISLMALGLFTNAVSFVILLTIGCISGLGIYATSFHITENLANLSSLLFCYCVVATIGIYFLRSRERAVQEEVGRMHVVSGSMAHEVKTPMAVNVAYAETVQMIFSDGIMKKSKGEVTIKFSEQQYNDLHMFLQKMVDLSLNSAKTVDMLLMSMKKSMDGVKKSEFPLIKAVKQGVDGYRASNSNADIDIDLPNKIKVFGAETYVANMMQNLVKNAFVHGGPNVKVKIYMKGDSIIVEDSGIGIPADIVPLIFGSFYTKSKDGTGLGLAFSKMVVTDMGGTISCESEEGKYTRFIITIPLMR